MKRNSRKEDSMNIEAATPKVLFCLILVLILFCSVAEATSNVFTIDGIRTAFFAEDGTTLEPIERDGVLFVPVLSLAESLDLNIEAFPENGLVKLNGVTMAFYGENNELLKPQVKAGIVYVPLVAFAESAGLNLTVRENTYSFVRSGHAEAINEVQPIDDQFGFVPITRDNYDNYFSVSQSSDTIKGETEDVITYTLTIYATTSYDLFDIAFEMEGYGSVRVPASGIITASYKRTIKHQKNETTESLWAEANAEIASLISSNNDPTIVSVSGAVRMSKDEADTANQNLYSRAVGRINGAKTSEQISAAMESLSALANINYADSSFQMKLAAEKKQSLLKQETDQEANEMMQSYENAISAMSRNEYDIAIETLSHLAKQNFLDSEEKLAEAKEQQNASLYLNAEAAEKQGELEKARIIFRDLALKGYSDSRERCNTLMEKLFTESPKEYHQIVYLFASSKDYHAQPVCGKRTEPISVPVLEAIELGYPPCHKCH